MRLFGLGAVASPLPMPGKLELLRGARSTGVRLGGSEVGTSQKLLPALIVRDLRKLHPVLPVTNTASYLSLTPPSGLVRDARLVHGEPVAYGGDQKGARL